MLADMHYCITQTSLLGHIYQAELVGLITKDIVVVVILFILTYWIGYAIIINIIVVLGEVIAVQEEAFIVAIGLLKVVEISIIKTITPNYHHIIIQLKKLICQYNTTKMTCLLYLKVNIKEDRMQIIVRIVIIIGRITTASDMWSN